MSKGTIIYAGNFELPDKGASAHRVMNNGKIFTALGYKPVFLSVTRADNAPDFSVSSFSDNVYEEKYPSGVFRWFLHLVSLKNLKKVISRYPDVRAVVLYNTPYIFARRVRHALKGVRVIYDCTEWNGYATGNFIKRYYKKFDEKQIENRLAGLVDGLIVISRKMFDSYKTRNSNLLLLPPLTDITDEKFSADRKSDGVFTFLFSGSPENKESLDKVVTAFRSLNNPAVRLKITGLTLSDFCSLYPDFDTSLLNDSVVFTGAVSHRESVGEILSCDCFVFIREKTDRNEAGFPTKFAEAFTCGVPVITTSVSDVKLFAEDEDSIAVLPSSDLSAVTGAMKKAIEAGPAENLKLRTAFHYENYIPAMKAFLDKLL